MTLYCTCGCVAMACTVHVNGKGSCQLIHLVSTFSMCAYLTCMYVHVCMLCIFILHACTCVYTYTGVFTLPPSLPPYIHTYIHTYTHMHTCTHACTHARTHIHMHTQYCVHDYEDLIDSLIRCSERSYDPGRFHQRGMYVYMSQLKQAWFTRISYSCICASTSQFTALYMN